MWYEFSANAIRYSAQKEKLTNDQMQLDLQSAAHRQLTEHKRRHPLSELKGSPRAAIQLNSCNKNPTKPKNPCSLLPELSKLHARSHSSWQGKHGELAQVPAVNLLIPLGGLPTADAF